MATYIKIASNTVGSGGAASVTFSSIPSTYTDLVVKLSLRNGTNADNSLGMSFNASSANFTSKYIQGSGSAAYSFSRSDYFQLAIVNESSSTANTFASADVYIPNYRSSNYKSFSIDTATENNSSSANMELVAGLWSNTAAITSITFTAGAGSFAQYSTATLYGISNA